MFIFKKIYKMNINIYKKFSSRFGVSNPKYWDVGFPYKQVDAFLKIMHTTYIFPTWLMPILRFF